jgi:hypothetical protein
MKALVIILTAGLLAKPVLAQRNGANAAGAAAFAPFDLAKVLFRII